MTQYNKAIREKIRDKLKVPGVRCYICKELIDINLPKGLPGSFELEDVWAKANGGDPNDERNLKPAHRRCNGKKGTMPADDAIRTARAECRTSREW